MGSLMAAPSQPVAQHCVGSEQGETGEPEAEKGKIEHCETFPDQ